MKLRAPFAKFLKNRCFQNVIILCMASEFAVINVRYKSNRNFRNQYYVLNHDTAHDKNTSDAMKQNV